MNSFMKNKQKISLNSWFHENKIFIITITIIITFKKYYLYNIII